MTQPPKATSTQGRFIALVSYMAKTSVDCIPDARMDEITKRLIVSLEQSILSDIVRSEGAPQDTSKLWYQPSSKKLYAYSIGENKWEETSVDSTGCLSSILGNFIKRDEAGCFHAILSKSEENLMELDAEGNILMRQLLFTERFPETITSDGSGNASVTVTVTKFDDDLAEVNMVPAEDLGATGRWWIEDQTGTSVTIKFAGLANATSYDVVIFVRQTEIPDVTP